MRMHSKSSIYKISSIISEKEKSSVYVAFKQSLHYSSIKQKVIIKLFNTNSKIYPLELDSLIQVKSPYCVSVLHFELIENKPALILEWVDGLSLYEFIKHIPSLSKDQASCICWQIQQGLIDLKKYGLCHGDLSPHNVLIDRKASVCLIDFGKGNYLGSEIFGTPGFIAEEILNGSKPHFYSDLFSLGILEKFLTGDISFYRNEEPTIPPLSVLGDCLLDPSSEKRKPKNYSFNVKIQETIASQVNKTMKKTKFLLQKTSPVMEKKPLYRKVSYFSILGILIFSLLFSGEIQKNYFGSISIRSHKWLEIKIKNHSNFTPFYSGPLPPGIYKIQWKSKTNQGVKILTLKEKDHIILTNLDEL